MGVRLTTLILSLVCMENLLKNKRWKFRVLLETFHTS